MEYAKKCPPLLAEKPVYIKNAFWAKLCVTKIEIDHGRHIIDTLNHKDLPVRDVAILCVTAGEFMVKTTHIGPCGIGGKPLPESEAPSLQGWGISASLQVAELGD